MPDSVPCCVVRLQIRLQTLHQPNVRLHLKADQRDTRHYVVAQGVLVEAYQQGPPPEVERQYEAAFSAAYDARSSALAREGEQLFGAKNAADLKNVDRERYMRRRLEAARINYRTNAVLGLGVIGARDALPLLNTIAAEPTNPMGQAARDSISALGEKSPDQQSP